MIVAGCNQVCTFVGFLPDAFRYFGLFGDNETVFPCPLTSEQKDKLMSFIGQKVFCEFVFDEGGFISLDCFEIYRDEETTTEFLNRKIAGFGD